MARSTGGSACAFAAGGLVQAAPIAMLRARSALMGTIDSGRIGNPLEEVALLAVRRGEQLPQRGIVWIALQRIAKLGDGAVDRAQIMVERGRDFGLEHRPLELELLQHRFDFPLVGSSRVIHGEDWRTVGRWN